MLNKTRKGYRIQGGSLDKVSNRGIKTLEVSAMVDDFGGEELLTGFHSTSFQAPRKDSWIAGSPLEYLGSGESRAII